MRQHDRSLRTHSAPLWPGLWLVFLVGLVPFTAGGLSAAETLHERIDGVVDSALVGEPARVAADLEFLRRVSLDLTGRIPTAAQARAFLADTAADKRTRVVDELLASPDFLRHMTTALDVMLMERRPDKHVPAAEWRNYLYESLAASKPFHELAREILATDGADPKLRPAAKFLLDRDGEPNLLTRDVGRMFFGMDLQCAQCHDHPLIDDYLQAEYYGLFAFLSRSHLFTDAKDNNKGYLGEKADGEASFTSVFTKEEGKTFPRLPGGPEIADPVLAKDDEYLVKPDKDVRPVPRYSRRRQLAAEATRGDNRAFNRNLANRLWAHMLGRGIVDPVDLHHADNPPSHAELLDLLADEVAAMNYDIRAFVREIALTRAYQRSIAPAADWARQVERGAAQLAQWQVVVERATAERDAARAARDQRAAELAAQDQQVAPLRSAAREAEQKWADAARAARVAQETIAATRQQLETKRPQADAVNASAAAVAQAAQLVAGEPDLVAAGEKFRGVAEKLNGELAALEAALPEQQKAVETAAALVPPAQQALDAARQQAELAAVPANELRQQVSSAETQLRLAENRLATATRLREDARLLADTQPLFAAVSTAQHALNQRQQERAATEQQAEQLWQQLAAQQQTLVAAQQAAAEQSDALTAAQRRLDDLQRAAALLDMALAKVREAEQITAGEVAVQTAAQDLAARSAQLSSELEVLANTVAGAEMAVGEARQRVTTAEQAANNLAAAVATTEQHVADLTAQCQAAAEQLQAATAALAEPVVKIEERWMRQAALAPLKPLSPEQMAWSMLQATGVLEAYRQGTEAELKAKPETPTEATSFARELEKAIYAKLEGNINEFVRLFGGAAGQPQNVFFATVDQALFFANGGNLSSWLAPSGDNLTGRLSKLEDPAAIAEELYLSVLTRLPTAEEVNVVREGLVARPQEKPAVVQELAWALLTSAEFRFSP